MDIKDYILWGGGALFVVLVILHGFWMARGRGRYMFSEPPKEADMHQADLPLDRVMPPVPDSALGDSAVTAAAAESERTEPAVDIDWHAASPDEAISEYSEEDADATTSERGRRVVIPGKRTEPTVPRTSRQFDATRAQRAEAEDKASNGLDEVVVIWVVAKSGASLDGHNLLGALAAHHLQYGGDVFRKLDPNTNVERYKVVNGVEPGTFDLSDLDTLSTPRIVMLLRFSAHFNAAEAFEDMLEVAQDVAATLDADLKDEHMSNMSSQTIEHCRQRIREYKRMSMRR